MHATTQSATAPDPAGSGAGAAALVVSGLGKSFGGVRAVDDISFEEGRGTLFMQGAGGLKIGDATSTKQNLSGDTEPMVVASSTSGRYYYNLLDPRGGEKLFPKGAPITDAGF